MNEDPTLQERKEAFLVRSERYRQLGYDSGVTARFVAGIAGPHTGPVLDMGSGKGSLTIAMAALEVDVIGIDLDPDEQALAALLAEEAGVAHRIRFIQGDAGQIPYPDDHFTCVGMLDVLHHLYDPDPVLAEMWRVVQKGGSLLLADFSEPGFEIVEQVHREEGGDHPRSPATVNYAEAALRERGGEPVTRIEDHLHQISVLRKPL